MNPDLKQPLNLPPIPWDRILKWSAILAVSVTGVSLLFRVRTFIILAQFIDVIIVLGLLLLGMVAIIAKYTAPKTPKDTNQNNATE